MRAHIDYPVAVVMRRVTGELMPRFVIANAGYGVAAAYDVGELISLALLCRKLRNGHGLWWPAEGPSP